MEALQSANEFEANGAPAPLHDVTGSKPFIDLEGKPTLFFLIAPLNSNGELVRLIEEGGGIVTNEITQYDTILLGAPDSVPDHFKKSRVFSYKYVEASVDKGIALDLMPFLLPGTGVSDDKEATSAAEAAVAAVAAATAASGNNNGNHPIQQQTLRYFSPEEDVTLLEEIRKRPWMGYKGHQLYKDISQLDYFKMKNRTPASLRERLRTLRYNVEYRYAADSDQNLLRDEHGNYIKDFEIKKKTTPFTALEDFEACKTMYENLSPTLDAKGFDQITFPTGYYDKYAQLHPTHTSESWRQRYKNFIVFFGIANYLKYYIITVNNGKTPLPANLANKDWLKARLHLKRGDGPRIYFPGIPEDDKFLEENLDTIDIPKHVVEPGEAYYQQQRYLYEQENQELLGGPVQVDLAAAAAHEAVKAEQVAAAQVVAAAAVAHDMEGGGKRKKMRLESHIDPAIGGFEETEFHDEPTVEFIEHVFMNAARKNGPPMNLDQVLPRKAEFLEELRSNMGDDEPEETKAFVMKLVNLGIQEYYLIFLVSRCGANKILIEDCIKNYLDTNGRELLAQEKGVWSNKSLDYLTKKDDRLNQLLIDYHGISSFNHQYDNFMIRQIKK